MHDLTTLIHAGCMYGTCTCTCTCPCPLYSNINTHVHNVCIVCLCPYVHVRMHVHYTVTHVQVNTVFVLQINCVVMKGLNDDELCDFVALTENKVHLYMYLCTLHVRVDTAKSA